jgi:hypothetical protein
VLTTAKEVAAGGRWFDGKTMHVRARRHRICDVAAVANVTNTNREKYMAQQQMAMMGSSMGGSSSSSSSGSSSTSKGMAGGLTMAATKLEAGEGDSYAGDFMLQVFLFGSNRGALSPATAATEGTAASPTDLWSMSPPEALASLYQTYSLLKSARGVGALPEVLDYGAHW